jgi:hypothetical protein
VRRRAESKKTKVYALMLRINFSELEREPLGCVNLCLEWKSGCGSIAIKGACVHDMHHNNIMRLLSSLLISNYHTCGCLTADNIRNYSCVMLRGMMLKPFNLYRETIEVTLFVTL